MSDQKPAESQLSRWVAALLQSPKADPQDRRNVLKGLGALGVVGFGGYLLFAGNDDFDQVEFSNDIQQVTQNFPKNFRWGAYTQSYEVEGGTAKGGRRMSAWDAFVRESGKIKDGMGADRACDFYEAYEADINLAKRLGVKDFRIGLSWSRILPYGDNRINLEGIRFYQQVLRKIRRANMTPWVTLHFRDMPESLAKKGGWAHRDSAEWFENFVQKLDQRLSRDISTILIADDPIDEVLHGYGTGKYAPGYQSKAYFFNALHNMNRAIALSAKFLREKGRGSYRLGVAYTMRSVYPATTSQADQQMATFYTSLLNESIRSPLEFGAYPQSLSSIMDKIVKPGDMNLFPMKSDFVSLNYRGPTFVKYDPNGFLNCMEVAHPQFKQMKNGETIAPSALAAILKQLRSENKDASIYITHLGYNSPYEVADNAGQIRDAYRVDFMKQHLRIILEAIGQGSRVMGVMLPFMDGFHWDQGYTYSSGLVGLNRETLDRLPKDSFKWYKETIFLNGIMN